MVQLNLSFAAGTLSVGRINGKVVEMKYSWRKGREGRDARLEMMLLPAAGGWLVAWFVLLIWWLVAHWPRNYGGNRRRRLNWWCVVCGNRCSSHHAGHSFTNNMMLQQPPSSSERKAGSSASGSVPKKSKAQKAQSRVQSKDRVLDRPLSTVPYCRAYSVHSTAVEQYSTTVGAPHCSAPTTTVCILQ